MGAGAVILIVFRSMTSWPSVLTTNPSRRRFESGYRSRTVPPTATKPSWSTWPTRYTISATVKPISPSGGTLPGYRSTSSGARRWSADWREPTRSWRPSWPIYLSEILRNKEFIRLVLGGGQGAGRGGRSRCGSPPPAGCWWSRRRAPKNGEISSPVAELKGAFIFLLSCSKLFYLFFH